MRFGNTSEQHRRGLIAGFVIGAIAYVFSSAMFIFYERLPLSRLIPLTFILVVPAFAIGLGIAPTLMFSIHIEGEWVEHRLFDRWTISCAKASNFVRMQAPSGVFAAILRFSDGTKIRFFGGDIGIISCLESELQRHKTKAEQGGGGNALEPPSHPPTAPPKARATP